MPNVTYCGTTYACTTAIKGDTYIRLLDENDALIADFEGISDFSAFSISGGSWESPEAADDCYVVAMRRDGTLVKTDKKACDLAGQVKVRVVECKIQVVSGSEAIISLGSYVTARCGPLGDKIPYTIFNIFSHYYTGDHPEVPGGLRHYINIYVSSKVPGADNTYYINEQGSEFFTPDENGGIGGTSYGDSNGSDIGRLVYNPTDDTITLHFRDPYGAQIDALAPQKSYRCWLYFTV